MASLISKFTSFIGESSLSKWWKAIAVLVVILIIALTVLGMYWSNEPDQFDVNKVARETATQQGYDPQEPLVVGYTLGSTLHELVTTLLNKPGGYISNDVMPPGILMDNMPSWEFGVLVQVRDLSRAMRKEFSRSQSQSTEDVNLKIAEPQFNFDNKSWALPSSESEYRRGNKELLNYLDRLSGKAGAGNQAKFYARSDNLVDWLSDVNTRLGSLAQRLSASVVEEDITPAQLSDEQASNGGNRQRYFRTPWMQVDNVFYEARGTTWALLEILRAVEVDFAGTLKDKNALVSMQQIIHELDATQDTIWSPMILNGSGFGVLANHSLVMASYISRANAALIDLRRLLQQG